MIQINPGCEGDRKPIVLVSYNYVSPQAIVQVKQTLVIEYLTFREVTEIIY